MTTLSNEKTNKMQEVKQPLAKKTATKKAPSKVQSKVVSVDTPQVLLKGKAIKLSPKSEGHVSYQMIKDAAGVICLQLTENTSGGIFSRVPVSLKTIITLLEKQSDRPFKSSIMKEVFSSKSSNNTSFLIAVLRAKEIALIVSSEKSQFLSVLAKGFQAQSKKLLNTK